MLGVCWPAALYEMGETARTIQTFNIESTCLAVAHPGAQKLSEWNYSGSGGSTIPPMVLRPQGDELIMMAHIKGYFIPVQGHSLHGDRIQQ